LKPSLRYVGEHQEKVKVKS